MRKRFLAVAIAVFVSVTLSACGSKVPRPDPEFALAGSAIKSAEVSGAREYAPIKLREARKKHDDANKAMNEKKYARAKLLSIEAQADAELARAAADTEKTKRQLQRARDGIDENGVNAVPVTNAE